MGGCIYAITTDSESYHTTSLTVGYGNHAKHNSLSYGSVQKLINSWIGSMF